MPHLPSRFAAVILNFAPLFFQRSWRHAEVLLIGAILAPGRRTVASILRITGLRRERRFVNYHRVLNRAAWSPRAASRLLLGLLVEVFVPNGPVVLGIDDTIERRRGRRIGAKGIYRDPVRSSHGHFVKASGLRWLSLMLLAPIPWAGRVWALPFLTALAPSERYCRERGRQHKTLTDWARQLALQTRRWLPDREIVLIGDSGFAALELLTALGRRGIVCITRLRLDAALYDPAPTVVRGPRGRACPTCPRCWLMLPHAGSASRCPAGMARATAASNSARPPPCGATLGCPSRRSAGCWCAIRLAASTRKPCCAPTQIKTPSRSWPASSGAGRWVRSSAPHPSRKPEPTSASRRSGSGRTWQSRGPRPACSGYSPSSPCWQHASGPPTEGPSQAPPGTARQRPTFSDTLAAIRRHSWCEQGLLLSRRNGHATKPRPALQTALVHALCHAA